MKSRGLHTQTVLSFLIVLVGIGLVVTGAVAAFVSSNSSASAALIAVGTASLLAIVFRDRIQEANIGGFEIKLALNIKDQLRDVLDLKVKGNYEGSESALKQAFHQFVAELDPQGYRRFALSQTYQLDVCKMLKGIVRKKYGGRVLNSSGTDSFYPLVDAVLRLNGARVREKLDERELDVCPDLAKHLDQYLRVGVTIRPGPDLDAETLVDRLQSNVKNGALRANCFLLIQNCEQKDSGELFRSLAHERDMHATSVQFPAGETAEQLDCAITEAIVTICTEPLPPKVRADGSSPSVTDPITVPNKRTGV